MEHQTETYHEREFDLDSRKLILIFFGFLAICGCFFVVGYILGNGTAAPSMDYADAGNAGNSKIYDNPAVETYGRMNETVREPVSPLSAVTEQQAVQLQTQVPSVAVVSAGTQPDPPEVVVSAAVPPAVNVPPVIFDKPKPQPEETPGKTVQAAIEKTPSSAKQATSAQAVYSVQVAAFRARREAETKAQELEAKGFESRIELPQTENDYYRIRVGHFATRAEAAEMVKQLKGSGFETMVTESKGN